jgi:hypothetical protein
MASDTLVLAQIDGQNGVGGSGSGTLGGSRCAKLQPSLPKTRGGRLLGSSDKVCKRLAYGVLSMMRQISEADWKRFRKVHPLALERFCERVLTEIGRLASSPGESAHERYLAVFRLLQRRDKELGEAFNDFRRSTALLQLALLRSRGLVTDEERARFSPETRSVLETLQGG